jgi:glycosyltransferase involved in cell wall biosynthesis
MDQPNRLIADARAPKPFGRIMLCVTEDWFVLSHFQPLIRVLVALANDVIVMARSSGRHVEIEALGARYENFDYKRGTANPVQECLTARALAARIRHHKPDALHLIAMKPILIGGLAQRLAPVLHTVVHMTGLGFMGVMQTAKMRAFRWVLQRHVASIMKNSGNWLMIENPDDLAFLEAGGARAPGRNTILGGAGIDPVGFPAHVPPSNTIPTAAYVGRMIRSKGVDVLMDAARILNQRASPLRIDLYGPSDIDNPEAIPPTELQQWTAEGVGRWHGPTRDVAAVWRGSDIYIMPTLGGEGLPRSLLEAAASARPVIVTDVPGCHSFVRDGVEGLVVPPNDARALADALERLAADPDLRRRMGQAARARVLDGYTIPQVSAQYEASYRAMAKSRAGHRA